jgi:glycosyltransferase involved in cell wall biosynthesis
LAVTLDVDDRREASLQLPPRTSRTDRSVVAVTLRVVGHDDGTPVRIRIGSDAHVPAEVFGTGDDRRLGVAVAGVQVGSGPAAVARRRYPSIAAERRGLDWLDTYQLIVANSEFTREWIKRWWRLDTGILHPPVTLQPALPKAPMILNVGRFFAAEHGHSKKQLELVRAFRALVARGRVDGWELHLVGGCSTADQPYLDKVRTEAEGLPVVFHVDASGAELRELYGRAAIYWHATGLGESEEDDPGRFEHFGITTVEAMSAGAVPVVIAKAGQLEVVAHEVSGFHFDSLAQLERRTEQLVADAERREQMSAAAMARAEQFGAAAFGRRLHDLVANTCRHEPELVASLADAEPTIEPATDAASAPTATPAADPTHPGAEPSP